MRENSPKLGDSLTNQALASFAAIILTKSTTRCAMRENSPKLGDTLTNQALASFAAIILTKSTTRLE